MRRYSFLKLKTFLNTKFWLFSKLNKFTTADLVRGSELTSTSAVDDGVFEGVWDQSLDSTGGASRTKVLAFNRYIRSLSNSKVFGNAGLLLRITNLARFFRSSFFLRRQWWRASKKFKCFSPFRRFVKVFRLNSFWRYPFQQGKILTLSRQNTKLRLAGGSGSKQRVRYFYLPKQLSKRIRSFYFLNNGFWRGLDSLITVRVRFTLNNLFITLTNKLGRNLVSFSSGSVGFKGTTKLTTYAIEKVALQASKFLKKKRMRNLYLIFNSGAVGYKSKIFIETLVYNSLLVKYLTVSDSIPHNGVRPRKTKRR